MSRRRGHVRERTPGRWEVIAHLGKDPITERERYKSRSVRGNEEAADKALRKLLREIDADELRVKRTFRQLSDAWLTHARPSLSPRTAETYEMWLDKRILPAIGDLPLERVTGRRLDTLYAALGAELAPKSVLHCHAIIHRAFKQAYRWGWVDENPGDRATPPSVERRKMDPPSPETVVELIRKAFETHVPLGASVWLAAVTGARRGELCALRWSGVDLVTGTLTISEAAIETGGKVLVKDTKTHRVRRLALDPGSVVMLVEYRREREVKAEVLGVDLEPDGYVFSDDPAGRTPLKPELFTRRFRRLCNTVGVHPRLHDLRHFMATQALAGGTDVGTVANRLGHADWATTLRVYTHPLAAADQIAADKLGAIVAPKG